MPVRCVGHARLPSVLHSQIFLLSKVHCKGSTPHTTGVRRLSIPYRFLATGVPGQLGEVEGRVVST